MCTYRRESTNQRVGYYLYTRCARTILLGTINLLDEQEVIFHRGHSEGKVIDAPNSEYCNIKLALARMMHACGASDMIAEVYGDDDDDEAIVNQPVYLGGPFVQLR